MLDVSYLSVFSIVKLFVAAWLFSHTLPRRKNFPARAAIVLVALVAFAAASVALGFSVFPTLTDELSFFSAIFMFVGVLTVVLAAQMFVFSCSLWTSLFCCSMAYLLENLSSAVERLAGNFLTTNAFLLSVAEGLARYWIVTAVVYAAAYALLIRRIEKNGLLLISDPVMVVTTALVIVVNMVLDLVIKDIGVPDFGLPDHYIFALDWIYVLLCIYLMYSFFEIVYTRRLRMNMAAVERVRSMEARQYELSRANIEAINLKCHDIKHQIRSLGEGGVTIDERALDDLSREVDVFDSTVRTGNDALNTILTEKKLLCQRRGITLSCVADGEALGFMEPADLYSLFGNALDNAIEAVERLGDPERRSISLVVKRAGDMVSVHVENYCDGSASFGEDGLPLTNKGDALNHGFGTRSMRMIAERYGGSLTLRTSEDVFLLDVLVPLP
ncbi:MAG TPA: ATP-binding protein [Candidatus Olsenella pullicola]|nr:ATP-binding protein [Candidatus Olsenella pullicola]